MELTNCNKAEIYAVDGTPLCEAHVYWDSAGMYQLLEVPCSFELSDTGEHMAIFYDSTAGLVHCRCQLRPHGNEGDVKSCSFTITEVLETIQRRQDLKVPTNAEIEISAVQMASASAAPPPKGAFTAVTENLSAGGVYFVCQYALPVDSEVHFELKEGPKPIELTAVVLRQEEFAAFWSWLPVYQFETGGRVWFAQLYFPLSERYASASSALNINMEKPTD